MLFPMTEDMVPFVASLQLELGGYWTRSSLQASLPPAPIEHAIRQGVLAQAVIAMDSDRVAGSSWVAFAAKQGGNPTPVGLVALVEPNPRAGTAWLDLALSGCYLPKAEQPYLMDIVQTDLTLFISHAARDWQLNRLFARCPASIVDGLELGKQGFERCGVLPDGCWVRGQYDDLVLFSLAAL